ncbi:microsomal triglyceride transfer protein large subunit [Agrilus planipennis]|uniref:Microsomal triglyceride transfer protein large subunit n=1 Tax=Agrilus planipennis TaxID=224129 RepID=A0A1W4WNT9_AGRPL|nr:microsomal triglyceride transfer protein large subunit [Agrilus planipennis]
MFIMLNSACAAHYLVFTWIFGVCYGFVLLSSAAGAGNAADILEPGGSWTYDMHTVVLLNEKNESGKDVGFLVAGEVLVQVLWGSSDQQRLLRFEMSPQLYIKSRKAPSPDGFIPHSSNLDSIENKQFFVHWNQGKINKILLPKNEKLSIANLKKGIASLMQFQLLDSEEGNETDSSGVCKVSYTSTGPTIMKKYKTDCTSTDLPYVYNPDVLLGINVESDRTVTYEIDTSGDKIKRINSDEAHVMSLNAKENAGNKIEVHQTLLFKEQSAVNVIEGNTFDEVLERAINQERIAFTQESLVIEKENELNEVKKFSNALKDCRENLKGDLLGKLGPAKSFMKMVTSARISDKEDIAKVLTSGKNKPILHQLYDILGFAQTKDSHEAAMKSLRIERPDHEEFIERYYWALSLSAHPNPEIINDLINRYLKQSDIPRKLKETLLQTISSMAYRLSKFPEITQSSKKIMVKVEEILIHGFEHSKDADDRLIILRALKNLKSDTLIPFLLKTIKTGTLKEGSLAWKTIKTLNPSSWNGDVQKAAWRTFFQLDKVHDSSARTIACDVLLESHLSDDALKQLLLFLLHDEQRYEVKQYLWQRIKMIGETDENFNRRVADIIKSNAQLNNYHILAPKGLSTALVRRFLESPSANGSLVAIQEMDSGIVKRGTVDIVLEKNESHQDICSLGIFSGGLGSFISSEPPSDPDESATAGIELTLLGTQIRPFVFFSDQGELLGHVWSGTASEMTPAFQALALLQDHREYVRLGSGFIAELDVKGAVSFDLSGKISISLWNKNAASVVRKSAGIVVEGFSVIDTDFVRSQAEFIVSIEPKLNLETDIDFYSEAKLCMKLSQPEFIVRHNTFKIERIPGSKHRLRKVTYRKSIVPGRTYALNKKNNEMCNSISGS